jgi:hypothetical protein
VLNQQEDGALIAFYRCYPIDDEKRSAGPPHAICAEDDRQVLQLISDKLTDGPLEVWRDDRLVARLTPTAASKGANWIIILPT